MSPSTPALCSGTCNAASIQRQRHAKDRGGRPGAHRRNRRVHQDGLRLCILNHLADKHQSCAEETQPGASLLRVFAHGMRLAQCAARDVPRPAHHLIVAHIHGPHRELAIPNLHPKVSHYGHTKAPTDAKSSHLGKALLVGRDLGCLPLKLRHKLRQLQLSQAHPIQKRVSRTCKRMVACDGQSRAASRTGRIRPAPCPAPGRRCIA